MKITFTTIAAVMTVLLLASTTLSAQDKKIEKKITVVTIHDGEKTVIDTTIVLNDTTGGTVSIRAPKEKSKEADRILAEVKKILEAK